MQDIENDVRVRIAAFIPEALNRALSAYREISVKRPQMRTSEEDGRHIDPADYKKQQEACKVAAAHVELLMKLARQAAKMGGADALSQENLETLLAAAQAELAESREI